MFSWKNEKNNLFLAVAITILALMAGAVGGIFIQNFFASEQGGFLNVPQKVVWRSPAEDIGRLTLQAIPMVAKLYRHAGALPVGASADPKNSYFSDDLVGEALVVTSDGWLLTEDSGGDFLGLWALTYDKKSYKIQKFVRDSFSKLVFLKIDAVNLSPARFGSSSNLSIGDYLFVPDGSDNLMLTLLSNNNYYLDSRADLIRFSGRLNRGVRLKDAYSKNLIGAPIFDIRGEAVGIFAGNDSLAVPIEVIKPILNSVLRGVKIFRQNLGVYYVNLALLENHNLWQKLKASSGALIWRDGESPFSAGSAARAAGLREGDIIVKIENEALGTRRDLAEIISEYGIGTTVNLGVLRNGREMTVEVVLK